MHNRRGTFKIKATKSSGLLDWANLKRMRNKISTAKKLFYSNKFIETNGNPRKTWHVINDLTSRKATSSSITEIKLNDISFTESSDSLTTSHCLIAMTPVI